ncbi:type II toxin-antitoxin system YafO family toxin [Serratia liquefaciens]|uniref:type II toxin-antitoxin system YafO family toxin n=1 Tax=Serratia liquefaciens TaxID=614 RepID=UPI0039068D35
MIRISIAQQDGKLAIPPAGFAYVRGLASALNGYGLSPWVGRDADFSRNARAYSEGIRHCHIRLMDIDAPWRNDTVQYHRTSDNFLIYARHWMHSDFYQALAIISPDAHMSVDRLLPMFCDYTERHFSVLSEHQLRSLSHVTGM